MRLDEIRKLVTESSPEDWNKITVGGTQGPSYKQTLVTSKSGGNTETVVEEHSYIAVYKENVDLSLAWGLEQDGYYGEKQEIRFDFTDNFASNDVTKVNLDVFWAGNLVDRYTLLRVDGARAMLPLTQLAHTENGATEYFPAEVVPFARLADNLTNSGEFDRHLAQAGLPVLSVDELEK